LTYYVDRSMVVNEIIISEDIMSIKNVELFQKAIIQDVALQDKLKERTTGLECFAKRVVQLGKKAGYHFTVEEVKAVSTKREKTAATVKNKEVFIPGMAWYPRKLDKEVLIPGMAWTPRKLDKEVLIPGMAWSPRGLDKEVLMPGMAWSPRGLDQALPV
ncbi:Nif11 family protein, partial [Candidatus Marithioploca araucensis]|nr:Nif11 family protein [Candidatus Marithioploca araucensis]